MRTLGGSFLARSLASGLLACALVMPADATPPKLVAVTMPVVEVLDPTGAITEAAVREALAKVEPALARCAGDAKWKGDALAWIVTDWHGKVTKLELAVDKPAVEKCFAAGLRALVIAKAQTRATAMIRLRFDPARPPA